MTTTVALIGAPPKIDRAVAAVTAPDSTLDAVAYLLRLLGQCDYDDLIDDHDADLVTKQARALGRYQALCWVAARRIGEIDAEVRAAPPSALAEVVADVMKPCQAPTCNQAVAPWQGDICGSPECVREVAAAFGEVPA